MSDKFSTTDLLHSIRHIPKSLISSGEKYVLIILLSCMNLDNKTWHTMEALASFACMSIRSMNRHLNKLEDKKFISIVRPDIYTHKMTNNYSLNLGFIYSFSIKSPAKLAPDNKVACQIGRRSHDKLAGGRMTNWHTKKEIKKETKRESALFPFEPDESNIILAQDLRLDLRTELESFENRHRGKKTQYEFSRWMKASKEYRDKHVTGLQETRSTVPEYGPGHPHWEMIHGNGGNGHGSQVSRDNDGREPVRKAKEYLF